MKILLLDMDGVLLTPLGYHKALQETVRLVAQTLGFPDSILSSEHIAQFEAVGITNEWDSSAISTALMLMQAWQINSQMSNPAELNIDFPPNPALQFPDLVSFFQEIDQAHLNGKPPLERAQVAISNLTKALSIEQQNSVIDVLRKAHDIEASLTMRTFQELVLGSQRFTEIYQREGLLETESYLLTHDRSNLSTELQVSLSQWLQTPDQHAVIFTNRPSLTPNGNSGTPETEIGAELVGLGHLPWVAMGSLAWLAEELGISSQALIKPSPVHALVAMRLASGDMPETALRAAAALAHQQLNDCTWRALQGSQVAVFEDSIGGIQSLLAAQSLLKAHNVEINTKAYGISNARPKQIALSDQGASVYETFGEALRQIL